MTHPDARAQRGRASVSLCCCSFSAPFPVKDLALHAVIVLSEPRHSLWTIKMKITFVTRAPLFPSFFPLWGKWNILQALIGGVGTTSSRATLREREKPLHSSSAPCYFCPSFYSFLQASHRQFADDLFLVMSLSWDLRARTNRTQQKFSKASTYKFLFFMNQYINLAPITQFAFPLS